MKPYDMWAGSMFILEDFKPKTWASTAAKALSLEKEKLKRDDIRRSKQIAYGYATKEYQYYIKTIPKCRRKKGDPVTPDKYDADSVSRRRWDGRVKSWRIALHKWYDSNSHPSTPASLTSKIQSEKDCCSVLPDLVDFQEAFHQLNIDKSGKVENSEEFQNFPTASDDIMLSSKDFYAGIYYQMMIQQNLILTWLFQNSSTPQFSDVSDLLHQFFQQQALILNCFVDNFSK